MRYLAALLFLPLAFLPAKRAFSYETEHPTETVITQCPTGTVKSVLYEKRAQDDAPIGDVVRYFLDDEKVPFAAFRPEKKTIEIDSDRDLRIEKVLPKEALFDEENLCEFVKSLPKKQERNPQENREHDPYEARKARG